MAGKTTFEKRKKAELKFDKFKRKSQTFDCYEGVLKNVVIVVAVVVVDP